MIKKLSLYTRDGEELFSRVTEFKGRFHEGGYSVYAHGNTINGRKSASFPKGISKLDLANMLLLSRHLQLNSNVLVYRTSKGYQPMDLARMGRIVGVQERQAYRFYKRMEAAGMMVKTKRPTQYVINPVYFLNGKTITDELYWIFNDQLKEQLPKWVQDEYKKRKEQDKQPGDKLK